MNIPAELKYSRDHEWVKIEGNQATVGITDYAQSQLGDVVFVEVPIADTSLVVGAGFCVVESVKAVSDIYAPVGGEIVKINDALTDTPEIINEDPYGEGWIAVIKIADQAELDNLLSSEEYEKFITEEGN
ncbi:glycine cleavage system protein GcvH [Propionispira raffinosivorans]|uniref:glycine cleavage system protein GcvH n=1 Tax=Propionispira raffinosivorans TaxID=86959 RepID=UPI0003631DC6|nr:glycine cleavage system protein GcvH [Propionispira raffinosivorans]